MAVNQSEISTIWAKSEINDLTNMFERLGKTYKADK
jgi:hypothetical protein